MTAEKLLKMYENKMWSSMHPDLQPQITSFKNLVQECEEQPDYKEYLAKIKELDQKIYVLKCDINDIVSNKSKIILKNSEDEYKQIYRKLDDELRSLEREKSRIEFKKPISKRDILDPIFKEITKREKRADEKFWEIEREKKNDPDYYR